MAVWILVAAWVALGLFVFFVAMRGGRRRRPAGERQSRTSRRVTVGLIAVGSLVFGVALPAFVLATNGSDAQKRAPGGVDLNERQVNGRELFVENCAQCHALNAVNAVGRVGPNLDELRPPEELILNAIEEGRARGNGQMPADLVSGQDARDVASFIDAVAGR
jgi:mono/diheme cytochrome c family protein